MEEQNKKLDQPAKLSKLGKKTILAQFRWIIVSALVFFLASWDIYYFRAWVYFIIVTICTLISTFIYWKIIPELANRRGKIQEGTKKWDKILILLYFLGIIFIIPLVAGLEIRFRGPMLNEVAFYIGISLYLLSYFLFQWTIIINKHFEGTARIQNEIGHKVVSEGPYKFIRHPGYASMILGFYGFTFTVGSLYGLIAYSIFVIILIARTLLEDNMLLDELEGYDEYSKRVKYRLIPFLW